MIVKYAKEGKLFSDFEVEEKARQFILDNIGKNTEIVVSNELFVNYVCVFVKEGLVDPEEVVFVIDDQYTKVDKYGSLGRYPKRNVLGNALTRLI